MVYKGLNYWRFVIHDLDEGKKNGDYTPRKMLTRMHARYGRERETPSGGGRVDRERGTRRSEAARNNVTSARLSQE